VCEVKNFFISFVKLVYKKIEEVLIETMTTSSVGLEGDNNFIKGGFRM